MPKRDPISNLPAEISPKDALHLITPTNAAVLALIPEAETPFSFLLTHPPGTTPLRRIATLGKN